MYVEIPRYRNHGSAMNKAVTEDDNSEKRGGGSFMGKVLANREKKGKRRKEKHEEGKKEGKTRKKRKKKDKKKYVQKIRREQGNVGTSWWRQEGEPGGRGGGVRLWSLAREGRVEAW